MSHVITYSYDPFMGTRGSPGFCELSIRSADESIENVAVSILS